MEDSKFNPIPYVVSCGIILLLIALLIPSNMGPREAAPRSQCRNNLKVIGLALHNYHEDYGSFPPAYVADDNGRPMHSWRVLILPYLDQAGLYNQYRFDEPWNGPHNSQFLEKRIYYYQCPVEAKKHVRESREARMTSYVAVVGPRTAFPGSESVSLKDISDGTSSVIAIVEVANSGIHWMEPRDLHVLQMATKVNPSVGQGISSPHKGGGAHALLCDGAVRSLADETAPETIRRLLEINDGEPVDGY